MADYKVVIKSEGNIVTCSTFNVTTGEYQKNLGHATICDYTDDESSIDKWFAVFSYDKREYESEIDTSVDEETGTITGVFDIPVFEKDGYIKVGIYGYHIETVINQDETTRQVFSLIYSPTPCLCLIKNGSYPKKPIPSPNTYEKLNRRIEELSTGIGDVTVLTNWKKYIEEEEFIKGLRNIFKNTDEEGQYVADYHDIYDLVSAYFGYLPEASGFDIGAHALEVLNRYFVITLKLVDSVWTKDKSYAEIVGAMKQGKFPIITYGTEPDVNYALYQNIVDDQISFSEFKIDSQQSKLNIVNFRITELDETYREEFNVGDIDPSLFELLSNKIASKEKLEEYKTSTDKYPSAKAIVDYLGSYKPWDKFENTDNKASVIESSIKESEIYYPSIKGLTSYAQDKSKIDKTSLTEDDEHYPSSNLVKTYSEWIENKQESIEETTKERTDYYPSIKATVDYVDTNAGLKFNGGKVERDKTSQEGTIKKSEKEQLAVFVSGQTGYYSAQTYNTDLFADASHEIPYLTVEPTPTEATIAMESWSDTGEIKIRITGTLEQTYTVFITYWYKDFGYKYFIKLTQDGTVLPEEKFTKIDASILHSGGGSGGGTSFDKVSVIKNEETEKYELKFYKNEVEVQVTDGSLAKVQLANSIVTPSEDKLKTNVSLKDKESNELTNFDLKFLTENEMTTLKGLI